MILEIAEFAVVPGKTDEFVAGLARGLEVIRGAEGCLGAQRAVAVEDPQTVVLLVRWRTLDDHIVTFRQGPLFPQYRQHINGLFVGQPRVHHYPMDEA